MDCFICYNCYCVIIKQTSCCPACKSTDVHRDRYGMVRRLIVACISTLTDNEIADLAEGVGCTGIGRNTMYEVIGKLIN